MQCPDGHICLYQFIGPMPDGQIMITVTHANYKGQKTGHITASATLSWSTYTVFKTHVVFNRELSYSYHFT